MTLRPSRPTKAAITANPMQSTAAHNAGSQAGTYYPQVPSIRLISATPSATGITPDTSTSFNQSLEESWATMSSQLPIPLAPKNDEQSRKKLVPKKSKLSILGMGRDKEKDRGKDLSDVVRRVGATNTASTRGGFEIYVDPTDPEIGEIVMIKKKKSRVALDGMSWGALGEVTNVPKAVPSMPPMKKKDSSNNLLKVTVDEEKKWWSIGRGRKDSKEKNKENKSSVNAQPVEFIYKPEPRSKTPEPFKPAPESRGRFNSLDSGLLLGKAKDASVRSTNPRPSSPAVQVSEPEAEIKPPSIRDRARSTTPMFGRSMTPTFGGLLAPSSGAGTPTEEKTGSIAIRAMKSMRSLARMGSWAQLKNMPPPTAQEIAEEMIRAESEGDKEKKDKKEKKSKAGSVKEKKRKEKKVDENGNVVKKKSTKKEKEKSETLRISTSSFEVGHLSASPEVPKTLGTKKHSILGLGLPASMRLPTMRGGSNASSINFNLLSSSAQANPGAAPSSASISISPNVAVANLAPQANRLSVESAIPQGRDRSASVASSNGSSLRPVSVASSNSRLSSGSSVVSGISGVSGGSSGASVRWDEEGLETVREQRRKDREVRRMSEDSEPGSRRSSRESTRRSLEARKRMPLSGVFEEVHHHQVGVAMLKDLTEVTEEESKVVEAISGPEELLLSRNIKRLSAESARTTSTSSSIRRRRPILTIEEATADGHAFVDEDLDEDDSGRDEESQDETDSNATPEKRARQRPLSEQMLGKSRPKPIHEDDEGVISILSAATQDLALLLNTLDLQATPGTPDMTPFKPSPVSTAQKDTSASASATPSSHDGSPQSKSTKARVALGMDSPLKNTLRGQVASIASLRPYAQSRKNTTSPPSKVTPPAAPSPLISSTATIRPKAPTLGKSTAELISQQIAPWPVLMQAVSPAKPKLSSSPGTISKSPADSLRFKPGHKRTMTPAPEPEAEPVFQPLKPARSRAPTITANTNGMATIRPVKSKVGLALDVFNKSADSQEGDLDSSLFSARTFGPKSATLSKSSKGSMTLDELTTTSSNNLTPVFRRVQEFEARQETTLSPLRGGKGSRLSVKSAQLRAPIGRETRKILGMSGTLGGSDVSMYDGPEPDSEDPDSDVPDELRFLLATHSNRTSVVESIAFQDETGLPPPRPISMDMFAPPAAPTQPPSMPPPPVPSGNPPHLDLPIFRASLLDDEQNQFEIDCGFSTASDEDTKKSFDFTGEIRMLNESGASDRASFVEQLEQAFKTPAKVDLRYDFNHLLVDVPPVPALPIDFQMAMTVAHSDSSADTSAFESMANSRSHLLDVCQPSMLQTMEKSQSEDPKSKSDIDMFTTSKIADILEPTMMHEFDSKGSNEFGDVSMGSSVELGRSAGSQSSDGELNRSFRFGGIPQFGSDASLSQEHSKPLTLSDIIPPPLEARAISEMSMMSDDLEDESVLKSIYAKLLGNDKAPSAEPNAHQVSNTNFTSHEQVIAHRQSIYRATSRPTSGISFGGLDSFDEVRRGFEFSGDRSFYPPPPARNGRRVPHRRDESLFSIASVSSYGHVLNNGVNDPFEYGLPSLQERPSSEDVSSISMSMTVDDTFEFLRNQPRRRVDSDASSFYFQAPAPGITIRGHRRRESNMSVTSQGPPISLYNRSFGHHRRNDSNTSVNSVSISYSKYGNQSAAPAWTRHNREFVNGLRYERLLQKLLNAPDWVTNVRQTLLIMDLYNLSRLPPLNIPA